MKILLVVEAALGGSGRHVLDLAEGLLACGNEVHLVYSPLRADRAFLAGVSWFNAASLDFYAHSIPIERELGPSDLRAYSKLSRYVERNGPFDVIHAHSTKAGFLARLLLNRSGARLVYTSHGLMTMDPALQGLRRRAVSFLEAGLARLSDAVIAVSTAERRCAIATGIPENKLVTIPNGVNTGERPSVAIRDALSLASETICVGWVGRLVEQKAPGRILEAFAALKQRTMAPVHLIVIGWGPLEAGLRRRADELRISNHVTFTGEVDGPSHIAALDILAHTATFEAFAYVFLEAFAAGIPIVTTRVGVAEDLAKDGITGYICDPWDPEHFALLLQGVVENPELRASMAASARTRAAAFTADAMVNATADLYHRVCKRPRAVPSLPVAASENNS